MNRRTPRRTQSTPVAESGQRGAYKKVKHDSDDDKRLCEFLLDSMMRKYLIAKAAREGKDMPNNYINNILAEYKEKHPKVLADITRQHVYNHLKKRKKEYAKNPDDPYNLTNQEIFQAEIAAVSPKPKPKRGGRPNRQWLHGYRKHDAWRTEV